MNRLNMYGMIVVVLVTTVVVGCRSMCSRVPILVYHHVVETDQEAIESGNDAIISVEKFRRDMQYLQQAGYSSISFEQLVDYHKRQTPLPKKPILITFDDGYLSNYEQIYPMLDEMDICITILVIGHSVGLTETTYPHFDWQQAREMVQSSRVMIQSHTWDLHGIGDLRGMAQKAGESVAAYENRLRADFQMMEDAMVEYLGYKPTVLAHPYCIHTPSTEKIAREFGYHVTLTTHGSRADISESLFDLQKFSIDMSKDLNTILKHPREKE